MLKAAVTEALCDLLAPVQDEYQASAEWKEAELKAYPPPEVKQKIKKEKKVGTQFPGAKKVMAKAEAEENGSNEADLSKDVGDGVQKLGINPGTST